MNLRLKCFVKIFRGICQFAFSIDNIFDEFNRRKVNFKDGNKVNEVMQLVIDLANNTRLQENNGHTPKEIFEEVEKPHLKELSDKQKKLVEKRLAGMSHVRVGEVKSIRNVVWIKGLG